MLDSVESRELSNLVVIRLLCQHVKGECKTGWFDLLCLLLLNTLEYFYLSIFCRTVSNNFRRSHERMNDDPQIILSSHPRAPSVLMYCCCSSLNHYMALLVIHYIKRSLFSHVSHLWFSVQCGEPDFMYEALIIYAWSVDFIVVVVCHICLRPKCVT